ncbi:TetR/AcrR family transcriptional regulator [Polaromonas sp.]|uniref:TetR/AcrR family transcriptional regulator n=1 Tax=Polaromonas sp. TaxID=1869339 RepID=UPI0017A7D912|nr:TetR/AcrR family transcriptional regulator [Polaromonas sp.]NML86180.1 TetR/AcrR family transcriptional regulator [Polaromonas sp.]
MEISVKSVKQSTEIRQAALVDAALRLAAQCSPAGITTGDLAQAVGITQGAVFRHFANKEAIWLAVLDWTADTLMSRLQAAADAELAKTDKFAPLAALQAVFMAHVNFVVVHPGVPRVIFQELQHAQDTALKARVRGLMQQYRRLLMGVLERAQEQRLLAPGTDREAAAVLFVGSVQGLVMQSLISGEVRAMARQALDVFKIYLRGLTLKEAL